MSLATTKANVEQLINDKNNVVIALSGKWGTGKSHMWREIQKSSKDSTVTGALYVSLFGVKDITQFKVKIVQSAIPDTKTGHVARELASGAWRQTAKALRAIHPGFAALDEIAVLAVPAMLRNRFIVIDDIERKHPSFDIGEVMGFIDEYSQIYGARILLILNSDQLGDKQLWETLREKVIDHEVALETTPAEAFDIAIQNNPSTCGELISEAVNVCKISNIRIIVKIIRTVNRLLSIRGDLTDEVRKRVIPSTVILAAIHYKGIHEGPDFAFVSNFCSMSYYMAKHAKKEAKAEETDQDRMELRWSQLMTELGIGTSDEYEELVMEFLKSGLLDTAKANVIFDRYIAEKDAFAVQTRCRNFYDKELWQPGCSDAELLVDATALAGDAHLLNAFEVTALFASVAELPGGKVVADQMVADWLVKFREKVQVGFGQDNFFKRELHPDIEAEFAVVHERMNPLPSLFAVCVHIQENSGWGTAQVDVMKTSTPALFESEIKKLSGSDLRSFMLKNMDLYINRTVYENHFGDAMWNFVAACRAICYENTNPRLTKIVKLVFSEAHLASLLDVYDGPAPPVGLAVVEVEPMTAPTT